MEGTSLATRARLGTGSGGLTGSVTTWPTTSTGALPASPCGDWRLLPTLMESHRRAFSLRLTDRGRSPMERTTQEADQKSCPPRASATWPCSLASSSTMTSPSHRKQVRFYWELSTSVSCTKYVILQSWIAAIPPSLRLTWPCPLHFSDASTSLSILALLTSSLSILPFPSLPAYLSQGELYGAYRSPG